VGEGGGWGREMAQTMYAHMNKCINKKRGMGKGKKKKVGQSAKIYVLKV
jgi:hypothetical protein